MDAESAKPAPPALFSFVEPAVLAEILRWRCRKMGRFETLRQQALEKIEAGEIVWIHSTLCGGPATGYWTRPCCLKPISELDDLSLANAIADYMNGDAPEVIGVAAAREFLKRVNGWDDRFLKDWARRAKSRALEILKKHQ